MPHTLYRDGLNMSTRAERNRSTEIYHHAHGLLLYCVHLKYVMKLKFYIFYFAGQTQMIHHWPLP